MLDAATQADGLDNSSFHFWLLFPQQGEVYWGAVSGIKWKGPYKDVLVTYSRILISGMKRKREKKLLLTITGASR
jgi:hypothetical protein